MIYTVTIIDREKSTQKKRSIRRPALKILSILLISILIVGIGSFILYPHYNSILLAKESLNSKRIGNSVTLQFFTKLSPPPAFDEYSEDFYNQLAVEYISPADLAKISNEGEVGRKLEKEDTEILLTTANIKGKVIDGENAFAMERGPWHFPLSSGPGEKGNFVIIGHRFAEVPPSTNTFYNLDKVKVGDKILIKQNDEIEYSYTVIESKVVEKSDRSVLANKGDYRLTLITCTPLWTSKERLIITAILDRAYGNI